MAFDIPYHFTVTDRDGTEVYHCPDYTKEGSENTYPQVLFKKWSSGSYGNSKYSLPYIEQLHIQFC